MTAFGNCEQNISTYFCHSRFSKAAVGDLNQTANCGPLRYGRE